MYLYFNIFVNLIVNSKRKFQVNDQNSSLANQTTREERKRIRQTNMLVICIKHDETVMSLFAVH